MRTKASRRLDAASASWGDKPAQLLLIPSGLSWLSLGWHQTGFRFVSKQGLSETSQNFGFYLLFLSQDKCQNIYFFILTKQKFADECNLLFYLKISIAENENLLNIMMKYKISAIQNLHFMKYWLCSKSSFAIAWQKRNVMRSDHIR